MIIVPTLDISNGKNWDSFARGAKIHFTFGGNVCHVFDKNGNNLEA